MSILETGTLVVFCKRPALGQGKQRLAETIGVQRALRVAECLLECALEDAAAWQGKGFPVVLSPASADDTDWAQSIQAGKLPQPAQVVPQPSGNLGQRLNHVDQHLRSAGHRRLIFIGTDAPAMTIDDLHDAAVKLDSNDVVLQPASDGGVTLMSASRPWPELAHLPWSSSALQQALCAACLGDGCAVWLLPGSEDMDEWPDLQSRYPQWLDDPRPARRTLGRCIADMDEQIGARAGAA